MDWSHGLLDAGEQRALRRVAVFMGGFSLEAAEQVCDATVEELEALVDQSLVLAEPHGAAMRYRLLETVREYGLGAAGRSRGGRRAARSPPRLVQRARAGGGAAP